MEGGADVWEHTLQISPTFQSLSDQQHLVISTAIRTALSVISTANQISPTGQSLSDQHYLLVISTAIRTALSVISTANQIQSLSDQHYLLVISTAIRTALSVISTANQISPTISHYQISTTSWSFLLQLEQPFQSFQLQSDQPHLPVIIRPAPPPGHFSCNEAPSLSWCLNKKFAYKRGGA